MAEPVRLRGMEALIEEYDMLPTGCTVLCAVSGGADSVFLLHELKELAPVRGLRLSAAHFNHHLRGEESDRDEQFVRDLCARWGVPCETGGGDVAAEAKHRRRGIEETAREMRYAFLCETAGRIGAARIVTAHNADDNLETMLLNLTRGAGLQGLTGIPPRQGILVRPLLAVTRREIEEQLRAFRLPHVEDSSNADETYSRNRMRRQALPLLEGFNPALRENSVDTIRYLRADNDYLNAQASLLSAQAEEENGEVCFPAALIASAPGPLAVRAVRQLLAMTGHGSTDCTAAHLEAVAALCRGSDPSGEVRLPHGLTARREYERLILTAQAPPAPLEPMPLREGENPIPGTDWTAVLDGPPWPGLVVRARQTGDELTLPGGRRRSLKKLLIDKKVPRWGRDTLPVAADGGGVIAVAGLGPNTAHSGYPAAVKFIKKEKGCEAL